MTDGGETFRRSDTAPDRAALHCHVHLGMTFHAPGDAALGLRPRLIDEFRRQEPSKDDDEQRHHDRRAEELRQGQLPSEQHEHDDAELEDEVRRSKLEGHGGGEVRPLAE